MVDDGDGDGFGILGGVCGGVFEVEGGEVVEDFLAVGGVEMDGDGVEGGDDIDDFGDGVELEEVAEAEDEV